jgi:hypothetical protein
LEKFPFFSLDMEPEQKLVKSRNRNRNFSKVGTGSASMSPVSTAFGAHILTGINHDSGDKFVAGVVEITGKA